VFETVHVIIDVPPAAADASARFWSAALGWPLSEPWPQHPEFRSLVPASGIDYVHLQQVDRGPRVHIDAEVHDVEAAAELLQGLGARSQRRHADWHTMRSPGGLEFCLLPAAPADVPAPLTAVDHRLRLVQICLDVPAAAVTEEVSFWRRASGWRWVPSGDEAFAGKLHHDGSSPVQLLLQALGSDDGGSTTRAHIDLGTDHVEPAVRRLLELGASRGPTGSGWVVLTDPVGMVFCVTGNPPD
jgi:hypothetical protein